MSDPTALREAAQAVVDAIEAWQGDTPRHPEVDWAARLRAALEAAPPAAPSEDAATHEHRASYPSPCEGCEHLAAAMVRRMPVGLRWTDDEFRADAIRAAAGDGGLREAAERAEAASERYVTAYLDRLDAVEVISVERLMVAWSRTFDVPVTMNRPQAVQLATEYARLSPALAHTESATDGSGADD